MIDYWLIWCLLYVPNRVPNWFNDSPIRLLPLRHDTVVLRTSYVGTYLIYVRISLVGVTCVGTESKFCLYKVPNFVPLSDEGDKFYVCGGASSVDTSRRHRRRRCSELDSCEFFSFQEYKWTLLTEKTMPTVRSAAAVHSKFVQRFGGLCDCKRISDAHIVLDTADSTNSVVKEN